jgi:hypothetical protein
MWRRTFPHAEHEDYVGIMLRMMQTAPIQAKTLIATKRGQQVLGA